MRHDVSHVKPVGSSTQIVLRFCQEIENTCAEIYTHFAQVFSESSVLKNLWIKIAAEEQNHAQIIGMAMRCKGLILKEKTYDMDVFRKNVHIIRELLENLQADAPTAEVALLSAIQLEKKLKEFHLDHVLNFTDPSEEKFFNQLMEGDKQHLQQLEETHRQLFGN